MKKILLPVLLSLSFTYTVFSQVTEAESKIRSFSADTATGWKKGGIISLSLSQTSLTNWAAGGLNSFATNGLLSVFANYKNGKNVWDNSLDVGYGILKQGRRSDFMKTDDKFDFLSKYGRKASQNLYYAALMNFKTQMAVGRDFAKDTAKISNLLAPAYVILALGLDYKPDAYFSAFVAPLTSKLTIVNDQDLADDGAFGVKAATFDSNGNIITRGENFRSELGGYVRLIYRKNDFKSEWMKNVAFTSKIDLFSDYTRKPQNIDVSWETQIALKVNKFISATINTHLIYDDDINSTEEVNGVVTEAGPKIQFKEILGVGFSYKFNGK